MSKYSKHFRQYLHGTPRTRREFLAQGLTTFAATTWGPTLFGLSQKAMADECGESTDSTVPYLIFDCAGGAALPANFLVGGQGGPEDYLPSYDRLGWQNHPKDSGAIDKRFGLPLSVKESKIFTGITQVASAEAQSKLRLGSLCHFAESDTGRDPLSAIALLSQWGYKGQKISAALGTENSISGGKSRAAFEKPEMRPFFVQRFEDISGVIGFGATDPYQSMTKNLIGGFFKRGEEVSLTQSLKFESSEEGKKLRTLMSCAYRENSKNTVGDVGALDPREDLNFQQVYQINRNTASNAQPVVFASLVKMALSSMSGPAVLTIGGCDYHQDNPTRSDAKDLEIGLYIGRAVEIAHRTNRPLFFQLLTDGGCSNTRGTRNFVSDANEKCMTVVGYYKPDAAPSQKRVQVGYFTSGQGAEADAIGGLGKSPVKVACAVFANYLSLHVPPNSLYGEFQKVVKENPFANQAEFESTLLFGV